MTFPPLLLIISGPAGSGKTTLCERLVRAYPEVRRFVTTTTRPPRPGEVEGVDYFFLERPEFVRRALQGAFLEYARVHGNLYGTERARLEEQLRGQRDLLLNIDVQGAESFRQEGLHNALLRERMVTVFIKPRDLAQLRSRLEVRGSESQETLATRLATAAAEIPHADRFDHVIVSGDREADFAALDAIYTAARGSRATSGLPGGRPPAGIPPVNR